MKNATRDESRPGHNETDKDSPAVTHPTARIIPPALVAGLLALASGCMTSNARVEPYRIPQSGIEELEADYGDPCATPCASKSEDSEEVRFTLTSEQTVEAAYARLERAFGSPGDTERASSEDPTQAPGDEAGAPHGTADGEYRLRAQRTIGGHAGVLRINIEPKKNGGSRLAVAYKAGGAGRFPAGEGFRRLLAAKIWEALH